MWFCETAQFNTQMKADIINQYELILNKYELISNQCKLILNQCELTATRPQKSPSMTRPSPILRRGEKVEIEIEKEFFNCKWISVWRWLW